jgi:hypothetical protein
MFVCLPCFLKNFKEIHLCPSVSDNIVKLENRAFSHFFFNFHFFYNVCHSLSENMDDFFIHLKNYR